MKFGSLFAGIGGFDLGLERAGMTPSWQVEIDDYATKILQKHWPDVTRFRDVRTVGRHNLPPVDLICGGFPCQDISLAGKGAGLSGERSGLWFEYRRIIEEILPRFVLIENVPALRSRGLEDVLGSLTALGYDAEWHCIPASAFGAPHRRDRVWIVAHARRDILREQSGGRGGPYREGPAFFGKHGQEKPLADSDGAGFERPGSAQPKRRDRWTGLLGSGWRGKSEDGGWWAVEPDVGRVAHGVPARVHRLRCLGNSVVPQVAEWIGRQIMEAVNGIQEN